MFRMIFTVGQKVATDEGIAGQDQANPEMSVTALNGRVHVECGGIALTLSQTDANNLTFALRKAVYEAGQQYRETHPSTKGGLR